MANRPRLHCPKCGGVMRRVYVQNAPGAAGARFPTVAGWAYCPKCDMMHRVAE